VSTEAPIKVPVSAEHAHPGPAEYVKIAIILAVVTAAEVGIYYMKLGHGLLIALLLFFSAIKFTLVVLWFMHLKFDSKMFRRLFIMGLSLAVAVYGIVLATFLLR
jgi:cytochrome c oxidase subunit 4